MRNRSVSMKMTISFGVLILLTLIISAIGFLGMYAIQEADQRLYDYNVAAVERASNLQQNFDQQRLFIRNLLIYEKGTKDYSTSMEHLTKLEEAMPGLLELYEGTIITEDDRALFHEIKETYTTAFTDFKEKLIERSASQTDEEAATLLNSIYDSAQEISDNLDKCLKLNVSQAEAALHSNQALFMRLAVIQGIVLLFAVLAAIFIARYMHLHVAKPLISMSQAATQISLGNLDVAIETDAQDEVGKLAQSFTHMVNGIKDQAEILSSVAQGDLTVSIKARSENDTMNTAIMEMTNNLNHIIREVTSVSGQVAIGASQVAQGSQSMAQGASEQATAIEQLSSSIYEISLNTKENAKMADKAASLYKVIDQRAQESSKLMNDMMASVEEISQASSSVSKIIKMINDISFQTNILSLNAAVEAANAGQHGRGFAVVAGEVRNLAMKSAKAAADTDMLIENTIQKAKQGSSMASKTASALDSITKDILTASQLLGDIAKATTEQALGIEQVNLGIDQVAQVVNLNSATAEQSAMAAEEMAAQASSMQRLVASFKLGGTVSYAGTPAPEATPKPPKATIQLDFDDKY